MLVALDPRNQDRPHSLERHRPDLPATDKQVDGLWSYAESPGGWYAQPTPVPELSTWAMLVVGLVLLGGLSRSRKREQII